MPVDLRAPLSAVASQSPSPTPPPRARHVSSCGARRHLAGPSRRCREPERRAGGRRACAHAARLGAMGRRARSIRTCPGSGPANVRLAVSRRGRAAASRAAFGCGRQAPRSSDDLGRLPAGTGQARGSAARRRRSRTERTVVLGADRPRLRARRAVRPRADCGGARAARGGHPDFERAVALFPEFGAAHYALALSYRATGKRDEAQAELQRHAEFGARWPALRDPVLETVDALREDPGALIAARVRDSPMPAISRVRSRPTKRRSLATHRSPRRTRT